MITLPDGQRFVPQAWHGASLSVIPGHCEAMASCRACGSMREVPLERLRSGRSAHMTIPEVAARLRCTDCGARDAELLIGYFAGDPPPL